jgi:histidinol-phosphate aminotransferase
MPPEPPAPRPAIARLRAYEWEPPSSKIARQAGVPEDQVVRFDTNTFPWPGADLHELPPQPINEYPDTDYGQLTEAIAQYADVPQERITVGAGADEVLAMLATAYLSDGATAVLSRPSYAMFTVLSDTAGATLDAVATKDFQLDRAAFIEHASAAQLTWLCNPNNPTGELVPVDFVGQVAAASRGVVVVDEAYFELSGVSALSLVDELPNLVVVRTLSKAFGLAGARIGYAIAGPGITDILRRVRPPGSISGVSAALATMALADADGMRGRVSKINAERARLTGELAALGYRVLPSAGNFLLVQAGSAAAPALLRHGLVVRTFPSSSPISDWIRITVRRPDENGRLIAALKASLTPAG